MFGDNKQVVKAWLLNSFIALVNGSNGATKRSARYDRPAWNLSE